MARLYWYKETIEKPLSLFTVDVIYLIISFLLDDSHVSVTHWFPLKVKEVVQHYDSSFAAKGSLLYINVL